MNRYIGLIAQHKKEIIYQVTIILLLFVFFSYNQDNTYEISFETLFAPSKLTFFINYLIGAMVINYVLLPKLYYKKRTAAFMLSVALVLLVVILIDELILEKIYFPVIRGGEFPGIPFTLLETLPIMIIIVAFKFAWDSNLKQAKLDKLEKLVRESEIQFLKSQINPHFLFNNLNNLYASAIDNSPKTPSIIIELSNVLRYMLYDCVEDYVPLTKEIEHLKNYTSLHELQIRKRGTVSFNEEITDRKFAIPPLLLVVFIENAFKHSAGSQSSNIEIVIDIKVSESGELNFTCSNNFSPDFPTKDSASGIGLENVRKRLNLLFANTHNLKIEEHDNMFNVALSIQLKPETNA